MRLAAAPLHCPIHVREHFLLLAGRAGREADADMQRRQAQVGDAAFLPDRKADFHEGVAMVDAEQVVLLFDVVWKGHVQDADELFGFARNFPLQCVRVRHDAIQFSGQG